MNFITFLLLVLTFPYCALWMIGYPIACIIHQLYVRARYGKWVHWQLLYPGQ